jgi:Protein of unknown function (DUF4232)
VATMLVALALGGCGSGSSSSPGPSGGPPARRRSASATPRRRPSPGVGMSAAITKVVVAHRRRPWHGHPAGLETTGSRGCQPEEGRGKINIYTDVPAPGCVRITGRQRVLIVNRTSAYHRREGKPLLVRFGPYSARIRPQQAALFGPVGRFFGPGLQTVTLDRHSHVGVLVLPNDCGLFRAEPGEPLCFPSDRAGRLRRWHRTEARMGAPACRGSDLAISAERHSSIGSGGTIYTKLFITNRSRRPCTVAGVPKVVGIDRRGHPVGVGEPVPLLRVGSKGGRLRVKLAAGGSATFVVTHYDGIGAGRCKFATTAGIRATVPGTGPRRFVPTPMGYCPAPNAGLGLRVGRIEPGP